MSKVNESDEDTAKRIMDWLENGAAQGESDLEQELRDLKRILTLVLVAAGGRVAIPETHVVNPPAIGYRTYTRADTREIIVEAVTNEWTSEA